MQIKEIAAPRYEHNFVREEIAAPLYEQNCVRENVL
jgi:hypothetical protein